MNKLIVFSVLSIFPALCNAQEPTRLQCEGTYSNYAISGAQDIPIKGVYLEISDQSVKVEGTVGFNGTYSIVGRSESGISFELESNKAYSGFINRFSGQLSLMEKKGVAIDGTISAIQFLNASCSKARSLF